MPWRRVDDHSRRLVDDYHVVIFENDVEWNVLGFGNRRNWWWNLDFDLIGIGDLHSRLLGGCAVYRYVPGLDKTLYPRPGEVGIEFNDFLVESLHGR